MVEKLTFYALQNKKLKISKAKKNIEREDFLKKKMALEEKENDTDLNVEELLKKLREAEKRENDLKDQLKGKCLIEHLGNY